MGKRRYAVITMVHNSKLFLPVWLRYYRKYLKNKDIYILDNGSSDGSITEEIRRRHQVFNIPFAGYPKADYREQHITYFHKKLEQTRKYDYIIVNDIDEVLIADPLYFESFVDYLDQATEDHISPDTRSVIQRPEEKPLDLKNNILNQRQYWVREKLFNKNIINKTTPFWTIGFHFIYNMPKIKNPKEWSLSRFNQPLAQDKKNDNRIFLLHLKRMDLMSLLEERQNNNMKYKKTADFQWESKFLRKSDFVKWFYHDFIESEIIPKRFKEII